MFNFEDAAKYNKDAVDGMMKSATVTAEGFQAIATELADYAKKSLEAQVAHVEKLFAVKSMEAAVELQTSFAKSSFEAFFAEANKIGDMVNTVAKDAYKPYEGVAKKTAAVVKETVEKAKDAVAA